MTTEQKAKAYDEALNWMRKLYPGLHGATKEDAERYFPELREEEKPLTPFQQCLNCILRGVYYAEVPDEKVNEFIVNVVRTRTDELIKLAKIHEYTDCQLRESEDERIRKALICGLSEGLSEHNWQGFGGATIDECLAYLEKQKDHFRDDTKKVEKQNYSGLNDLERAIHRGFLSAGVENVPVTIIKETAKECLAQMKTAEWSEEDEDMLNCCISSIEEAKENRYAYKETDGDTSYDREIDWLKSLRPSWKPSEEQMKQLHYALTPGSAFDCDILNELYIQLKKLK